MLADWIVDLAEHAGYLAQTTSVPGVAQRTGSTDLLHRDLSRGCAEEAGKQPVLALMPVPGEVDIVIASELMEAGRAVQRGLVTPDRTTLIASTPPRLFDDGKDGDGRWSRGRRETDRRRQPPRRSVFVRADFARIAAEQRQRHQRASVRRAGQHRRIALHAENNSRTPFRGPAWESSRVSPVLPPPSCGFVPAATTIGPAAQAATPKSDRELKDLAARIESDFPRAEPLDFVSRNPAACGLSRCGLCRRISRPAASRYETWIRDMGTANSSCYAKPLVTSHFGCLTRTLSA